MTVQPHYYDGYFVVYADKAFCISLHGKTVSKAMINIGKRGVESGEAELLLIVGLGLTFQ